LWLLVVAVAVVITSALDRQMAVAMVVEALAVIAHQLEPLAGRRERLRLRCHYLLEPHMQLRWALVALVFHKSLEQRDQIQHFQPSHLLVVVLAGLPMPLHTMEALVALVVVVMATLPAREPERPGLLGRVLLVALDISLLACQTTDLVAVVVARLVSAVQAALALQTQVARAALV
jgi:hypothetical protein